MLANDGPGDGLFLSPVPVPKGDPAALSRAAATFSSAQGEIDRSHATLVSAASQGGGFVWSGLGAAACSSAAGRLAVAYAGTSAALGRGATALRAYSANLEAARRSARRANEAVTAANATARALTDAQAAVQRTQQVSTDAARASTAADAQAAASPYSPAAHVAAESARSAASDAASAANEAAARMSSLASAYDTERSAALSLCASATDQAGHATARASAAFDAAASELTGMSPRPARGGAAGVPGKPGHESFWSSFLHGAEHLGEDVVNATASVGNSVIHDPAGVFSVLGGLGLVTISSGGEVLGVGLDATGVGAVAGVPLNAVSAAGIAGGATMVGAGASSIIRNAAGRTGSRQCNPAAVKAGHRPDPPIQPGVRALSQDRRSSTRRRCGGWTRGKSKTAFLRTGPYPLKERRRRGVPRSSESWPASPDHAGIRCGEPARSAHHGSLRRCLAKWCDREDPAAGKPDPAMNDPAMNDPAMKEDAPSWLVQEVSDLLDVSSVGLYEFIWLLRGAHPDVPDAQLRSWAQEALRRLLDDGSGRLVLQKWPSEEAIAAASAHRNTADDWSDPTEDRPYVAITRT